MTQEELTALIDSVLDGVCTEADFLRLEAELQVRPDARQVYYERLKLHTVLQLECESQKESDNVVPFRKPLPERAWFVGIAAAGVLLLVGSLAWQLVQKPVLHEIAKVEPAAAGFGVVAEQSNAVWESQGLQRGDLLPSGMMKLRSGIAQLELFSGVTVVLEGEAEFEVHSSMEMTVLTGKLRAIVPKPARGFRVKTASGEVVDLGTEFAIEVTPEHADLHVLNGEIEWHPEAEQVQRLVDGESMRWTVDGEKEGVSSSFERFPGLTELKANRMERYRRWQHHSRELRQDPRLLVYFPMEQLEAGDRQVVDESQAKADGVVVRAMQTADRWGQPHQALDFSPTGSRVRLSISGEHEALTFYCWVRIDSLDRWYNSLFLTDGHELQEPHWQIMDDGRLFFSVKKQEGGNGIPDKHIAYSPPIWSPALSGTWMQIATVYDSRAKTTSHYVNGEMISQDQLPDKMVVEKVRIGSASLGNWSEPMRQDPHFAVRNLNGAMDEFAIFADALTAREIAELYESGKP